MRRALLMLCLVPLSLAAQESFHRAEQDREISYWLLDPASHQFRISHDFTVTRAGQKSVHSFVRKGSVVSPDAKMIDVDTGKELRFETVSGKEAKSTGLVSPATADDAPFIKVWLPAPVPKGGETRIRILKTYTDAASYFVDKDGRLVFTRPLGIKRNVVLLPKGWELIECASPGIVSTDPDGRVRVSFLNDRDDQLPVTIVARRLP